MLACSTSPAFLFLTRPGEGNTGSEEESRAYYGAMTPAPEPNFDDWLKNRCMTPETSVAGFYYNDTDLGLGREMRCAKCTTGPRAGLISCAVTNHGIPQGLDLVQFGNPRNQSITGALTELEKGIADPDRPRGATVAMDYDPSRAGNDKVRFYIYDASDVGFLSPGSPGPKSLIPGLQLDREGGTFNQGVKYMRNCLSCHGGRYNREKNVIEGATFLDFDLSVFVFANDQPTPFVPSISVPGAKHTIRSAENFEQFRIMNSLVREVASGVGAEAIVARIDGSYAQPVTTRGAPYVAGYVPPAWASTPSVRNMGERLISGREFFGVVVHRYCSSCHFAQVRGFNLTQIDPNRPLTFFSPDQWFQNTNHRADSDGLRLIKRDVCGSGEMPHADVTRSNLLRDARALSYICN